MSAREQPPGTHRLLRSAAGPALVVSPGLELEGLLHGFATRQGGVSPGGFASLNFGLKGGDAPDNVAQNLRLLAEAAGFDAGRFYRARQVHGAGVLEVTSRSHRAEVSDEQADALVTAEPGCTVGVVTADCVPVLFACLDEAGAARAVAAAHAGWRGIVGGVLEATVAELRRRCACDPAELRVAVGPCIGVARYEVGPEVAARFAALEGVVDRTRGARPHLDLLAAVRATLLAAGIPPAAISLPRGLCTHARAELFYSYRRDGAGTGLQLSFIGLLDQPGSRLSRAPLVS